MSIELYVYSAAPDLLAPMELTEDSENMVDLSAELQKHLWVRRVHRRIRGRGCWVDSGSNPSRKVGLL
jgi:hypothetical protein